MYIIKYYIIFLYNYFNSYTISVPLSTQGIQGTVEYIKENGFLDKQSSTFIIVISSYNYNLEMYYTYILVKTKLK